VPGASFFTVARPMALAPWVNAVQPWHARSATTGSPTTSTPTKDGPQRPWSLGLFPLIHVRPRPGTQIEAGISHSVCACWTDSWPTSMARSDAGRSGAASAQRWCRATPATCAPCTACNRWAARTCTLPHLTSHAGPDGNWWVVSQRTQAPSGLGYLLENRLAVSRLFPQAFEEPAGPAPGRHLPGADGEHQVHEPRRVRMPTLRLLTPGPYNETYFEHAYLARYLGHHAGRRQ
jgi:hypothetical protein